MSDGARTAAGSRFGALLAKPWFAIVAGAVALALIATGAIIAIQRFGNPFAAPGSLATAPSAFALSLTAIGSPATDRGQPVPVLTQALSPEKVTLLELWNDDRLVLRVTDPENVETSNGLYAVSIELDHVPTTAGEHTLIMRATTADGHVALSTPLLTATRDLPADLGQPTFAAGPSVPTSAPFTGLRSAPGDTLTTIAGRLAVPIDSLLPSRFVDGPDAVIPPGTRVVAPISPLGVASDPNSYSLPIDELLAGVSAAVEDCTVVVTSHKDQTQFLYGGSPLLPIGEVPALGETVLTSLPIGTSSIVAYVAGAKEDVKGANAPSPPVSVTVPEDCRSQGWSGDALVVNDALVSDLEVPSPYLYVSFDRGEWQRIPAAADSYLPFSSAASLAQYADFDGHDQIDLELWSVDPDGTASKAGSALFCRAEMTVADPGASSASGGPCEPQVATGSGTTSASNVHENTVQLSISTTLPSGFIRPVYLNGTTPPYPMVDELNPNGAATGDAVITVTSSDLSKHNVRVELSYTPISPLSTMLAPAGVFRTFIVETTNGTGSVTIQPGKYRNLHITDDVIFDDAGELALDDELARSIATSALLQNDGGITDLYVRAVELGDKYPIGTFAPGNVASLSIQFHLATPPAESPTVENVNVYLEPGIKQDSTANAYAGRCLRVQEYPEADTYRANPYYGPHSSANGEKWPDAMSQQDRDTWTGGYPGWVYDGPPAAGHALVNEGDPTRSDLAVALTSWPNADWIYCEDANADRRYAAQQNAWADEAAAKKASCGLVCFLRTVVMGALIGFVVGGPYGALIGAAIGAAAGAISVMSPGFQDALKAMWNAVTELYNAIYDTALNFIEAINVACLAASAASDKAGAICNSITDVAVGVVFTAVTGMPPQLPVYDVYANLASGDLELMITAGMELVLNQYDLSCDTFSVPAEEAAIVEQAASASGDSTAKSTLATATAEDGSLSACAAVANVVAKSVRSKLVQAQGEWIAGAFDITQVPGLILRPFSDTSPILHVEGTPPAGLKDGYSCPATANLRVVWGVNSNAKWQYTLYPVPFSLVVNKPTLAEQAANRSARWDGIVPIPIMPKWGRDGQALPMSVVIDADPITSETPYLIVDVASPCLAENWQLPATFSDGSLRAFDDFSGDATAYYLGFYGLTYDPTIGSVVDH